MDANTPPKVSRLHHLIAMSVVIGVGVLLAIVVANSKPKPEPQEPEVEVRPVRALAVVAETVQAEVWTQGTVAPKTEIGLVSQVSGQVVEVSPNLRAGGAFKSGDVLLRIDPRDFELRVIRAKAQVTEARQRYVREKAEADIARQDWEELGQGEASPLVLREPQLADAKAKLRSAEAALAEAELQLERTRIVAPFDGRVRQDHVDFGQFVTMGGKVADVFSTDVAEIRLPLSDVELALIDLPLSDGAMEAQQTVPVTFTAEYGGKSHTWTGQIVRTEGVVDAKTHLIYAVAEVEKPYAQVESGMPMTVGMFVNARIQGKTFENAIKVPRDALYKDNSIVLVNTGNRLRFADVQVLQKNKDHIIVRAEFDDGDRVALSPPGTVTENMHVHVIGDEDKEDSGLAMGEKE